MTGDAGFDTGFRDGVSITLDIGSAEGEAIIELQVAGLRDWVTFDIGSTGWGADIVGARCWGWRETNLLRQIQVVRWVQNPAAQSEFKERTLLRPRTRGQIKLELEHLGD